MRVNTSEANAEHAGAAAEVAEASGTNGERIITDGYGDQFVRDSTGAYVNAEYGITYRGEVRNGTMNGTGTQTFPNGRKLNQSE